MTAPETPTYLAPVQRRLATTWTSLTSDEALATLRRRFSREVAP